MPIVTTFLIDTCRNIDENKISQALVILRSCSKHGQIMQILFGSDRSPRNADLFGSVWISRMHFVCSIKVSQCSSLSYRFLQGLSLSGLSGISLSAFLAYIVGQMETKILLLVCSTLTIFQELFENEGIPYSIE